MSEQSRKGPSMVPSWIRDDPPSVEERQAAAEAVLERGYVMTTVIGDEYRLSTRRVTP